MARSPSNYTAPKGSHVYADLKLTDSNLDTGEIDKRLDRRRYPKAGVKMLTDTSVALTVAPASPQLAATILTLTGTVTRSEDDGPLTGSITFKNGASTVATVALSSGAAQTTTTLPIGTHSLTAVYSGADHYGPSTSPAVSHTAT